MCAIAVIFGDVPLMAEPLVRRLLAMQRHRGYVFDEIVTFGGVGLGANRLQIVSPENAQQPGQNEAKTIAVVLNGEIYNWRCLREELELLGHSFSTDSDTEVIAHAYEQWGADFCCHLDGMYAIALFDQTRNLRLLARDPCGVKPLYFGGGTHGTLASSEVKALVGLVENVELLPPGHIWINGISRPHSAEGMREQPEFRGSFAAAATDLLTLLDAAVAKRIPENLPLGVFVSGGIDSSLILALAARHTKTITAFSVGMPGSKELERAAETCDLLGVRHVKITVDFQDLVHEYSSAIHSLESFEPNLVRASLPTLHMCRAAREHGLRVAIAGEGADELFFGYKDFEMIEQSEAVVTAERLFHDLHRTQLLRWDKIGMSQTIEVRTPLMDKAVVAFAQSLPSGFKLRPSSEGCAVTTKAVLREAAKLVLPAEICNRAKVPMDEGLVAGGRSEWTCLWQSHFSQMGEIDVCQELQQEFALFSIEERLNFKILAQVLPPAMISRSRIAVRKH